MFDKIFDKLPYDTLEGVKLVHVVLVALGLGLLLGAAYYFTLYTANQEEMALLENQKVELTKTLKRYRLVVSQREAVTRQLALVRGNLDALKRQMPKEEEMPRLLKRVAEIGRGLGLQILLFGMEEGTINDFYKEIPININFRGRLWKTLDMFDGMQNLLRLVDFSNVLLDVKMVDILGGDGMAVKSIPMLHTSFTAKTFSYIEGSEDKLPATGKKK